MTIHELIAKGQCLKIAYEKEQQEIHRRHVAAAQAEHDKEWKPILERVANLVPPELRYILTPPSYSAITLKDNHYASSPLTMILPDGAGRIFINTNTRYRAEDAITFQAMAPRVGLDEYTDIGFYVRWEISGSEYSVFLIALAEAAQFAAQLPTVQDDVDRKNAERLAEKRKTNESAPQPVDWLNSAILVAQGMDEDDPYQDHTLRMQIAQIYALIAIAQEIRKLGSVVGVKITAANH